MLKIIRNITVRHLWAATLLVGIFAFINTHPIRPHDFWWHMALGREIVTTGRIPSIDVYSFTMSGQPYPSYQMFWLADVSLYTLYSLGGPALVTFTQSLIIAATYLLVLLLGWQSSRNWGVTTLVLFFAAALGLHNWNVRPQIISYLIGAFYLYAIYAYRRSSSRRWLVVFPVGMLIWANSHGSFAIGCGLLGIWLAAEIWEAVVAYRSGQRKDITTQIWPPFISLLLAGLACMINPRGPGIMTYVLSLSANPIIQNLVPEWAPPTFDTQIGVIFYLGLLFCTIVLALSPRRPDFFQLATFLAFALLGMMTTRGVVWFGLVMAPILAIHLSAITSQLAKKGERSTRKRRSFWINATFMMLLILIAVFSLPWFKHWFPFPKPKAGLISYETPLAATDFLLSQDPAGNLFNEMGFGSYLIWAAQPEYKVFVDPRIELYSAEIWKDYILITNGIPGWEDKLATYGMQTLMVSPSQQASLLEAVKESPDWQLVYQDEAALIFTNQSWP
jgi:hypothetical protein